MREVRELSAVLFKLSEASGPSPPRSCPSTVESSGLWQPRGLGSGGPVGPSEWEGAWPQLPPAMADRWSPRSPTGPCICTLGSSVAVPTMEGPLRRKTLLKEGRKPAVSAGTPPARGSTGVSAGPGLRTPASQGSRPGCATGWAHLNSVSTSVNWDTVVPAS